MKQIYQVIVSIVASLFILQLSLCAQNRRTYVVLQDNSGSFYQTKTSDLQVLQSKLIDLFENKNVFDDYCIAGREMQQGIPFFNKETDELFFYWFVSDQKDNYDFYLHTNGHYKFFEDKFFILGGKYDSTSDISIRNYLENIFNNRPPLKSQFNSVGLSTYSFTSFAYPLFLDILTASYSEEYIVILISDFKAGSTFGNKQDEKIFKDAFKSKAQSVLTRVAQLNSKFLKIDVGDFYKDYNGNIIGFYTFKVRPNAGYPNPENIEVRLDSDIKLTQAEFEGSDFTLNALKFVFKHTNELKVDKLVIDFEMPSGEVLKKEIKIVLDESNGTYRTQRISTNLPGVKSADDVEQIVLKFDFYTSFKVDEQTDKTIKYTFDTSRTITQANFDFRTKLSPMQINSIIILILLFSGIVVALILRSKGKPRGIDLKFARFNNTFEACDYSSEGLGKIQQDYKSWSTSDEINTRFEIKIQGRLIYDSIHKFYNWQEQTGFRVRIYPVKLQCPEGFDAYVTGEGKISNNGSMPIELIRAFKDSIFQFSVVFQNKGVQITEPSPFAFDIAIESSNNGFRSFEVSKRVRYNFFVGPDLGNVWLGLDPGTTGSCIAVASSSNDLVIEKDSDGKDLISPSVILIPTGKLKKGEKQEIRTEASFGAKAQAVAETETMLKFVSIKKLLGYKTQFDLGKNRYGEKISVDSSFLSTLMIEKLIEQQRTFINNNRTEYPQFFENGSYAPKRAVIAIPNNFTASKIEHLKECVLDIENSTIKELRFIYEAEAILVNYINSSEDLSNVKFQESEEGETLFIFDMGGATINTTLANIKRRNYNNNLSWEIEIICKLGYGVGGDTIDYAYLKWIYSKQDQYDYLSRNNPFGTTSTMEMAGRRKLKDAVLKLKMQTIRNYTDKSKDSYLDRYSLTNFNERNSLPVLDEDDPFNDEIKKDKEGNFLRSQPFKDYVYNNVQSIVEDVLTVCRMKNISVLNTVLMSGRSSHFPLIKETIERTIHTAGFAPRILRLSLTESKSAVAKGACFYGVQNGRIKLQNRTVSGVFGVMQTIAPTRPAIFHKLINDGDSFDSDGVRTSTANITSNQGFEFDGRVVRFCQVMGVNPEEIIAKNEKHKYSIVAAIPAQPFPVKQVQMSITNKDKILCSVTDTNDDTRPPMESIVNDSDIMACNDEQYTFFVSKS